MWNMRTCVRSPRRELGGGETGVVNGEVSLAADEGKYEDDDVTQPSKL
jgi:hypothetical protein